VDFIASLDGIRETGNRTTVHRWSRLKLYLIYYPCSLSWGQTKNKQEQQTDR